MVWFIWRGKNFEDYSPEKHICWQLLFFFSIFFVRIQSPQMELETHFGLAQHTLVAKHHNILVGNLWILDLWLVVKAYINAKRACGEWLASIYSMLATNASSIWVPMSFHKPRDIASSHDNTTCLAPESNKQGSRVLSHVQQIEQRMIERDFDFGGRKSHIRRGHFHLW